MRWAWRGAWLSIAIASTASAHLRFPTVKAERFVEVRLDEEPIRIGYRIGLGTEKAAEERKRADANKDGEIDTVEGNAALDRHTDELLAALEICTGPTLDATACKRLVRRNVELVSADGWQPQDDNAHLHFAWRLRLDEKSRDIGAIRVSDAYDHGFGVEMTDVEIAEPAHAKLTLAGEEGRKSGVANRFSWIEARRAPGPRVAIAEWPVSRTSPRRVLVFALLAIAIIGIGFWWSRRYAKVRAK
jgi:hypothetical protein